MPRRARSGHRVIPPPAVRPLRQALQVDIEGDDIIASWADKDSRTSGRLVGTDDALFPLFVRIPWNDQDTRLRFERNDAGAITGLTLSCDMVRGVSFEKRP